jgi:hypothetical protein
MSSLTEQVSVAVTQWTCTEASGSYVCQEPVILAVIVLWFSSVRSGKCQDRISTRSQLFRSILLAIDDSSVIIPFDTITVY